MYASGENSSGNVPAFLMKVWTLVEDPTTDELIYWDPSGTSFHVFDQQRFSREILPNYFKHSNIASFIRQLNMYGFRKVAHIDQGGLKIELDDLHFQHPYFQRGEKELLQHIKRKVSSQTVRSDALTAVKNDEVSRVLTDVNQMKSKQQDTEQNLDYIKRENKLLWREIATLRQKHHKQQEIVNKLIQFLVSLVSSNRTGLTIPPLRRAPLAIDSSSQAIATTPGTPGNNPNVSEETLVAGIPHNYTIESPKAGEMVKLTSPNPSGPIIHELSEASPNFLHSQHSLIVESSPFIEDDEHQENPTTTSTQPPVLIMKQSAGVGESSSVLPTSILPSPLQSPKIEQVPTLEEALHFDWMTPSDALPPSFLTPAPTTSTLPATSALSQGKSPQQKRKRTKPAGGLSIPESSPTKKANSNAAATALSSMSMSDTGLMTPDILSADQANSTLDQLVMSNNSNKGDATLALSASNNSNDDINISSNQLDFLSSDLDGLRGLLQDQYKMDPSILFDLFETSNPWPIVSDKNPEDELDRKEEPSTSDDGGDRSIIGTELVQYNPKELFPDLLEDGVIGDIDDID